MKRFNTSALALLLLIGCGNKENPVVPPDAGDPPPDAREIPDAGDPPPPPPPQIVTVSGRVTALGSYLAGTGEYVGGASVLALGVQPQQSTISQEEGSPGVYSLDAPANGQVVFFTNKVGYFPTYTAVTTNQTAILAQTLYLTETAWLNAIATAHGVDLNNPFACHAPPAGGLDPNYQCVYAIVVGRILDDGTAGNGTRLPVAGVSAADFTIKGGPDGLDWYAKGPYFLDPTGTPNPDAQTSVVVDDKGGLYITFVEVPMVSGPEVTNIQISIAYNDAVAGVARQFGPQSVQVYRPYGVSWSNVYETGIVPPPPPGDIDFDSQIYPLFLPVNQGGFGCQGCHTNQGGATPAGGMNLYGGPEVAYASLDPANYPQRVNTASPGDSYILRRPLYEPTGVQDHPIFAFASNQDPAYQLIYQWITQGAKREVVLPPVSFRNEIRPLLYLSAPNGGAGCYACHVSGVDATNAPGGFYMGGTPEDLYAELLSEAPTDNGGTGEPYRVNKTNIGSSLLLINPLSGNPEPHPVKIFGTNLDPRYQLIYRWIAEGALDDGL